MLKERLDEFKSVNKNDKKAECLLPTELSSLLENELNSMKLYPASERGYGITNPNDEESIRKALAEKQFL